jgi:putative membrane protein
MKTKSKLLIAALIPLLYLTSCDDPKNAAKYNMETTVDVMGMSFINAAAEGGHTEIAAAKVAAQVSKNPKVVDFANMMITDHTAAGEKLQKLMKVEFVSGSFPVNHKHTEMIDTLSKLSGDTFDKAYMQFMVDSHQEAVEAFEGGTENRAPHVQHFAKETLPTIEHHLEEAKNILASLK